MRFTFIYADLIVLLILDIYRRYYTAKIAGFLGWTQFASMGIAGLVVELLFKALGWIRQRRSATIAEAHISFNYTTVLNVLFLIVGAVLVWRAATTGGFAMLRHMNSKNSGTTHEHP